MTQEERINRINELYHLSKERPLTEEELKEQGVLRAEYLSAIRSSVKGQLGQIRIVEKDGSINPLVSIREKKENFRKEILAIRNNLDDARRKDAEEFLTGEVLKITKILKTNKVLMYASKEEEVPTDAVFEALKKQGIACYYPVTKQSDKGLEDTGLNDSDRICFYSVNNLDELTCGTFQVREPAVLENNAFQLNPTLDSVLILVPGLSFDNNGNRIGYGKGYYDRFLAGYKAQSSVKSAGVCFSECKVKNVPVGRDDQKVDFVITV